MRVLGIDLGMKRSGMALSDELSLSISLLPNMTAKNREEAVLEIYNLCLEKNIAVVLIGFPKAQVESKKAISSRAIGLQKKLQEKFAKNKFLVQVILWDETLSSKTASKQLVESGVRKSKRAKLLDAQSAAVLVRDYLDCKRTNSEN